tara:strand:+ start:1418 stop:1726 length:309 start_codon:yes stop_codon:yes gene_type:complete
MKELYDKIVNQIKECSKEQDMFILPSIDDFETEESPYSTGGATLFGKKYVIKNNEENIIVTYETKDKCRTFQVNPDLNIVTVEWSNGNESIESYKESWSDKM